MARGPVDKAVTYLDLAVLAFWGIVLGGFLIALGGVLVLTKLRRW